MSSLVRFRRALDKVEAAISALQVSHYAQGPALHNGHDVMAHLKMAKQGLISLLTAGDADPEDEPESGSGDTGCPDTMPSVRDELGRTAGDCPTYMG
jgi:hypothetical protein